jgi:hypothetical protein
MSKKINKQTKLINRAKNAKCSRGRSSSLVKGGLTVLISVLIAFTIVQAGSLTPSASPAATGYTLSDIYTRLITNGIATEGDHDFAPSASPAGTLYTLTQIYEAIPTIVANMVKLGTSYLGVDGTLVPSGGDAAIANVCNGNTFFGSSQTDWNLQTGTLNPTASTIISGNTYCGVAGTAEATPTFGDNDESKVLTIAGNAGTYNATNLSAENVRNAIAFGVGQTGTFTGNLAYGDDSAANVLTTASTPGTYNVSNLSNSVIKQSTTWGVSLGSTGTLTPDGGTAAVADLFNSKTAHLTADWNLDSGTLDLACNTATFDGTGNIVADAYDGAGTGSNRWCMTDSGDAATSDILSGKVAWVDGVARTGVIPNCSSEGGSICYAASGYWTSLLGGDVSGADGSKTFSISDGYYSGKTCTANDTDLVAGNIRSAVNIFGVAGDSNVVNTSTGDAIAGDIASGKIGWVDGAEVIGSFDPWTPQWLQTKDDWVDSGGVTGEYTGEEASWTAVGGSPFSTTGTTLFSGTVKKDLRTDLWWSDRSSATLSNEFAAATDGVRPTGGNSIAFCNALNTAVFGGYANWYLPTQKELQQAYIDGSANNLPSPAYGFWSSTERSWDSPYAWYVNLSYGNTSSYTKVTLYYVRCVRR